ncbi:MAG: threonine ammonia-lyase, biosynthetic [Fimbriimonadaceae bacterium]
MTDNAPTVRERPTAEEYLRRIIASRVYDVAVETPLELAPLLSERTGNRVWLKREDRQPVFSFKLRGAYEFMVRQPRESLARGVIAASAGNHAQGVALAARKIRVPATIVVPQTTPKIKIDAICELGAELVQFGDSYDDAYRRARELEEERDLLFVHPYDDPWVIAGQGTIGVEIYRQHPDPIDAVFVAVGGGGLIAGIALGLKQLMPDAKVIGVEPDDCDAMHRSLRAGKRVKLDRIGMLADGVAVKQVGEETFRIARDWVDDIVVVSNDEICGAVKEVFEDRRAVLEPAGALAYAGLKRWAAQSRTTDRELVAIACGANLNFDRLRYIAERAQVGEHREGLLAITIPERPGSFRTLCAALGPRLITEFNYRMGDPDLARVFVGVAVRDDTELADLVARLRRDGYETIDLTGDEVAKNHVRHMVGGRSPNASNERLFHFGFPERVGALAEFLDRLAGTWNISLFHYRNVGADRGRALVGIQVPPEAGAAFSEFLASVGSEWTEETDNAAIRMFL